VRQKKAPVRVILGNPPYSIGQKSANDNAQNRATIIRGKKCRNLCKESTAGLNKSLYDAYIKAFRWSTDRLDPKNGGIICFVQMVLGLMVIVLMGLENALKRFFFDLCVDCRVTSVLVANYQGEKAGRFSALVLVHQLQLHYWLKSLKQTVKKRKYSIMTFGDYLSREEKLEIIKKFHFVGNPD